MGCTPSLATRFPLLRSTGVAIPGPSPAQSKYPVLLDVSVPTHLTAIASTLDKFHLAPVNALVQSLAKISALVTMSGSSVTGNTWVHYYPSRVTDEPSVLVS